MSMKNRAVFLDRDGTINVDKGFAYKMEDFEFIDGAIEAIRLLNESNFRVLVVSNQSGIGRGYFTEEDLQRLHRFISEELVKHGAWIDKFYYCPHHPEATIERYRAKCECRKPRSGLLEQAIEDFDIDVYQSFLVGDSLRDIEAGRAVGYKTILVGTTAKHFEWTEVDSKTTPTWLVNDLRAAVDQVLVSV